MDLGIKNRCFFVSGATSGFGKSIATALISEGAHVLINARGMQKLAAMKEEYTDRVDIIAGDITQRSVQQQVFQKFGQKRLDGVLINAGGPPAMSFQESGLDHWDAAYRSVLRWKVAFLQGILPKLKDQQYGRVLLIESVSVKQPIENLVLSNAFRLSVVGFVKTLAQELAREGITLNILAPGYHATPAMDRLFVKKGMLLGISPEEARRVFEREVQMGVLGDPDDLAFLALWLLSPQSGYMTGQTIAVDGGLYQGI